MRKRTRPGGLILRGCRAPPPWFRVSYPEPGAFFSVPLSIYRGARATQGPSVGDNETVLGKFGNSVCAMMQLQPVALAGVAYGGGVHV